MFLLVQNVVIKTPKSLAFDSKSLKIPISEIVPLESVEN